MCLSFHKQQCSFTVILPKNVHLYVYIIVFYSVIFKNYYIYKYINNLFMSPIVPLRGSTCPVSDTQSLYRIYQVNLDSSSPSVGILQRTRAKAKPLVY